MRVAVFAQGRVGLSPEDAFQVYCISEVRGYLPSVQVALAIAENSGFSQNDYKKFVREHIKPDGKSIFTREEVEEYLNTGKIHTVEELL